MTTPSPIPTAGLTDRPFGRYRGQVTMPLFCACTTHPLGAFAQYPHCPQQQSLRTLEQTVQFGPEIFDGHYGQAFKLGFPNYTGPIYQATIPAFNVPGQAINPNGPFLVLGDKYSPYFRLYNIERK